MISDIIILDPYKNRFLINFLNQYSILLLLVADMKLKEGYLFGKLHILLLMQSRLQHFLTSPAKKLKFLYWYGLENGDGHVHIFLKKKQ